MFTMSSLYYFFYIIYIVDEIHRSFLYSYENYSLMIKFHILNIF